LCVSSTINRTGIKQAVHTAGLFYCGIEYASANLARFNLGDARLTAFNLSQNYLLIRRSYCQHA
jgi:hypothetical protein